MRWTSRLAAVDATLIQLAGTPVLAAAPDGPDLDESVALDLIATAMEQDADIVMLPAQRCPEAFFTLRSGLAGAVTLKFANYRQRLAVVGDIAGRLAGSDALRAFVAEANRGDQLWFFSTRDELAARLARAR